MQVQVVRAAAPCVDLAGVAFQMNSQMNYTGIPVCRNMLIIYAVLKSYET